MQRNQEEMLRMQQRDREEMKERIQAQREEEMRRDAEDRLANRPAQQISIQELLGVQPTQGQAPEDSSAAWGGREINGPRSGWSAASSASKGHGGKNKESMSLLDIQREEERQMKAEQKQQAEIDAQRRQTLQVPTVLETPI